MDSKGRTYSTDPQSSDELVYMLKHPNPLDYHWVAYRFISNFSIYFDCGLFCVNRGVRPYADICGVCVCAREYVHGDADALRRSQTVIGPCTENKSFLYNLECFVCVCVYVCLRERKIYVHMTHEQVYVQ